MNFYLYVQEINEKRTRKLATTSLTAALSFLNTKLNDVLWPIIPVHFETGQEPISGPMDVGRIEGDVLL
jgi:hypothetical protein